MKENTKGYISDLYDRNSFIAENDNPGPGAYCKTRKGWGKRSFNIKYLK